MYRGVLERENRRRPVAVRLDVEGGRRGGGLKRAGGPGRGAQGGGPRAGGPGRGTLVATPSLPAPSDGLPLPLGRPSRPPQMVFFMTAEEVTWMAFSMSPMTVKTPPMMAHDEVMNR